MTTDENATSPDHTRQQDVSHMLSEMAPLGNIPGTIKTLFLAAVTVILFMGIIAVARSSELLDFTIYYEAGRQVLREGSPYGLYGSHQLPYTYAPWIIWLFLPLCVWPIRVAWFGFVAINMGLQALAFWMLIRLFRVQLSSSEAALFYVLSLIMGLLLLNVGQTSVLQLTAIVTMMVLIRAGRPGAAGLMFPLVLLKPHLMILVVPTLWKAGGRKLILTSLGTLAIVGGVATVLHPNWGKEMLDFFVLGQARNDRLAWNFTTLAALLGLPRQWNARIALVALPIAALIVYRFRHLPQEASLAMALSLSLLVAPYSFAYDLPLLLPGLIWLTRRWSWQSCALWLAAATIPIAARYSSGASLVTLLVVAQSICCAWRRPCFRRNAS